MRTRKYEDRESWLVDRRGKVTGSRLGDIYSKRGTRKLAFYELIAERLGIPADDESPMDRGSRLEPEAIARFAEETGKKVDTSLVMWSRDDDDSIAISPDGFIGNKKVVKEAVEAKCLSSARHIEAWCTKEVPDDYRYQVLQYFIVNDKLETLYFVFYDPRIPAKDFFYLTITREQVQEQVEEILTYQRNTLAEVDEIVNQLTF